MKDKAIARVHLGDWSADELALVMATLTDQDPESVRQVAAVLVIHPPEGGHELVIATTISDNRKSVATIFEHAARHVYGGCDSCKRRNAEGGRNATP